MTTSTLELTVHCWPMFISDVKTYHYVNTSHEINLQSAMRTASVFSNLGDLPHEMGELGQKCIVQNLKITHAGLQLCNNG